MTRPYAFGSPILPGLAKFIEECGEGCQVGGKLVMTGGEPNHWEGSNLHLRIEEEMADIEASIYFARRHWKFLNQRRMEARIEEKLRLYEEWHKLGEDRSLPNG